MFIIEGPDNVGKTTAAKRLVHLAANVLLDEEYPYYPIRYAHMSRPNKAFDFCHDYRDIMSMYAVQDRFHLGALVWHEGVMDKANLRLIESWLLGLGTVTVVWSVEDSLYETMLETNSKEEMFDNRRLIEANRTYSTIGLRMHELDPIFDIHWHSTVNKMYPNDDDLLSWLRVWYERLTSIPRY